MNQITPEFNLIFSGGIMSVNCNDFINEEKIMFSKNQKKKSFDSLKWNNHYEQDTFLST